MAEPAGKADSRIANKSDADRLVSAILQTMAALEQVLVQETELMRKGRIREALDQEPSKSDLAGAYMQGLETIKSNALSLARYAPDAVAELKSAHERFARIIETNQAVLATAHAVSEGLMRGLAAEAAGQQRAPSGYGPAGAISKTPATPSVSLAVSKNM